MKTHFLALLFAMTLTACGGGGGGGGDSTAVGIKPPTAVSTVSAN